MDKLDIDLIKILQENSRITISELSKRLALSRPSIAERIIRLQERGIIEEFTTRISLKAIGRNTILFIELSSLKVSPEIFEDMIREDQDILECHRVTGHINYFIKAAVNNMESMSLLIDRLLPYGNVNTSVVLKSPVPYRHIVPYTED
ncbi:transcriptional regulator, AsnC family [Clostridium pasteurianum DSM 525 = ATCC 6013]|jgi:Lrp/AsnC family leucine-responsive transcriptional regulator|uniref:Transcriptional regulator, AsnC family n=1 Tax=Clostridium pasteurianum DSM 525 = ATCC 6013 TaxID=1262449 RepID=A0A0H3J6L7_CLOPA|nr:Lrp/AsnC family transcriptional regulator [Clostridium pasteurianum]AJA46605.1 transcriptional regulator, AsnC family [Clostridium pasteurianum DSM 525 = ATCC 6013]AJA50593.1 transcriptional regulator, AsnC family [Clostridium pasteurianum DSM 525 = ATCC 6013]AOZ74018.1 AsnC family transcriptional regulator [Clostridium pasteurianum DSM 525 = ATCC 6013]AOZ77815.1 AsnC family transcriptional regulator [Clostridium pasteurianum]ELP61171.1 AsnC family transcriptional regulator [Clostridium pas